MNGCYLNHENGNHETCSLKTSKNNSLVLPNQVEFLKETIPQYIVYTQITLVMWNYIWSPCLKLSF